MTTGAVYLHFKSKEKVWRALTRQASGHGEALRQLVGFHKAEV